MKICLLATQLTASLIILKVRKFLIVFWIIQMQQWPTRILRCLFRFCLYSAKFRITHIHANRKMKFTSFIFATIKIILKIFVRIPHIGFHSCIRIELCASHMYFAYVHDEKNDFFIISGGRPLSRFSNWNFTLL